MAKCDYCKQEMTDLNVSGCTYTHAKKLRGKKHVLRDTGNITGELRCHDCGAMAGYPHHPGCDNERCPFCLGQAFMCNCKYELAKLKNKPLKKSRTELRPEDRVRYLQHNGVYCPYCESNNLTTLDTDMPDFGCFRSKIGCEDCKQEWDAIYRISEIHDKDLGW